MGSRADKKRPCLSVELFCINFVVTKTAIAFIAMSFVSLFVYTYATLNIQVPLHCLRVPDSISGAMSYRHTRLMLVWRL